MKKALFLICTLLIYGIDCNSQNWIWAHKSNTTTAEQIPKKVCTDQLNNVFVIGHQNGNSTFGSTTLNPGSFIAKYSSSGILQWAKNIDGTANDIKIDPFGNMYILGNYTGVFNSGGLNMISSGSDDIYLVKYNSAGHITWGKSFGGTGSDKGNAMQIDNTGNIYFTGSFTSSIFFDTISLSDLNTHFFLTKVDPLGNVLWAKKGLGNYNSGYLICTDKLSRIYVIGAFSNNCMYCNGEFIAKYDTEGNMLFNAYPWGAYSKVRALGVDENMNIFVTENTGSHYYDEPTVFKFDSLMNVLWYRYMGNGYSGTYFPNNIVIDPTGNVYIPGIIGGDSSPDSVNFGGQAIHCKGPWDVVIAQLDSAGNFGWIKTAEGTGEERPTDIVLDNTGSFYVTGFIHGQYSGTSYDTVTFGTDILHNDGSWPQFFISKLDPTPPILTNTFLNKDFSINIYPNPSTGIFEINFRNKKINTEILVYNLMGNCVTIKDCRNDIYTKIDLSNQPKGLYFMEIISDGEKFVNKIVLQ